MGCRLQEYMWTQPLHVHTAPEERGSPESQLRKTPGSHAFSLLNYLGELRKGSCSRQTSLCSEGTASLVLTEDPGLPFLLRHFMNFYLSLIFFFFFG